MQGHPLGPPSSSSAPQPWRSRGYLPHFEVEKAIQAITFRLADSLPARTLEKLKADLERVEPEERSAFRRKRLDFYLDSGLGSCALADPRATQKVEDALLHFDGIRYRLLAWVVMPNHVHVLVELMEAATMSRVLQSWKSFTARWMREQGISRADPRGHQDGPPKGVWQREYWDRYVRDEAHFARVMNYIHQNPVKAGLVQVAEEWRWSSARLLAGR